MTSNHRQKSVLYASLIGLTGAVGESFAPTPPNPSPMDFANTARSLLPAIGVPVEGLYRRSTAVISRLYFTDPEDVPGIFDRI